MSCGSITQGFTLDCDNPMQGGLEPQVILMNLSDIQSYTVVDNKITDIILHPGKSAYLFEGIRQSVNARYEQTDVGLTTGYAHEVSFQIFDISSDQKEELFKMAIGKLVAIVFNMHVPGNEDGYFEVFGIGAGMGAIELSRANRDLDTQGSWSIVLNTGDLTREAKMPYNFFDTDYNTTLEKILALLNIVPSTGFPFTFPFTFT